MSEREETHDFMTVDSFSQLPYIRRQKPPNSPIRLFGFDFPSETSVATSTAAAASTTYSVKKFECHYCSRNFPTSQALGGHQNAHKRERQHTKRAHLKSAIDASEGQMYGLLAYHRLAVPAAPTCRFPFYPSGPFNGSLLPDMWRIIQAGYHQQQTLAVAAVDEKRFAVMAAGGEGVYSSTSSSNTSPRKQSVHELKDGVSLDLHL